MTTANQLAGYASSLPNFRNKIINGHLKSDKVINQRGASSITGATGYTYDRWYYDGSTYLYQGIEDANVENGTYAISWVGSGINAAWKVSTDSTAGNGPDATTGFTSVSNGGTFTVNETTEFSKHLWIQFSGTLSNLDKVQVELGTVATPFEHRPYGMELSLCQRYFEQLITGDSESMLCSGFNYSNTQVQGVVQFEVKKRAPPTMGYSVGIAYQATGETARTNITPQFYRTYTKTTLVYASASGVTAGQGVNLTNRDDGTGRIYADAEL